MSRMNWQHFCSEVDIDKGGECQEPLWSEDIWDIFDVWCLPCNICNALSKSFGSEPRTKFLATRKDFLSPQEKIKLYITIQSVHLCTNCTNMNIFIHILNIQTIQRHEFEESLMLAKSSVEEWYTDKTGWWHLPCQESNIQIGVR